MFFIFIKSKNLNIIGIISNDKNKITLIYNSGTSLAGKLTVTYATLKKIFWLLALKKLMLQETMVGSRRWY